MKYLRITETEFPVTFFVYRLLLNKQSYQTHIFFSWHWLENCETLWQSLQGGANLVLESGVLRGRL